MCSGWGPDPPNILCHYIIAISKLNAVWLTRGDGGCFLGKSSLKSRSVGLTVAGIFFYTNTLWVNFFCRWQMLFFGQKCDEELVGRPGGQTLLLIYLQNLFSCKLPVKTVTVTTLLLLGHITLPNDTPSMPQPVYPFTLVQFGNTAPLILPPEVYQRHSQGGGGKELAQDPRIQMAVWMGLVLSENLRTCLVVASVCKRSVAALGGSVLELFKVDCKG